MSEKWMFWRILQMLEYLMLSKDVLQVFYAELYSQLTWFFVFFSSHWTLTWSFTSPFKFVYSLVIIFIYYYTLHPFDLFLQTCFVFHIYLKLFAFHFYANWLFLTKIKGLWSWGYRRDNSYGKSRMFRVHLRVHFHLTI